MTRPFDNFNGKIVLAGAGKMGQAMLEGWLKAGLPASALIVLEPHPADAIAALCANGLALNPVRADAAQIAALVIAVKPQMFAEAAPMLRKFAGAQTVAVSIMAGRTLQNIAQELGGGAIVRAMPNTPAAIGRGISVAVPSPQVSAAQRALAEALLAAAGKVEWVEDESLMDAVTALSGSGPAYVFLLAEELARAGVAAGLPEALAITLARETVAGSGELLHRSPLDAATLRQNVTSPGGTTAAALNVLMDENGLRALLTRAVDAATRRSRELAS